MVTTVDLEGPHAGAELIATLERDSCAFVVGHGVGPDLRRRMVATTRAFFALDEAVKDRVRWDGTGKWRGWQPVYQGRPEITGDRAPDLLERFEAQDLETFRLWPDEPPEMEADWGAYYGACQALSTRLVHLMAAELALPEADLPAWTTEQFANLVANHYLPQPEPPLPGQVRTGAHTDRGGFTLLWAEQVPGGLEVRAPGSPTWTSVLIPEEAFLLQVGDMFSRWVNGRIKPNIHRVVNPPREVAATASRLALVYFHYPNLDTVIEPAPSCVVDRVLPPLVAGEHLLHRQEHFKHSPDYAGVPTPS